MIIIGVDYHPSFQQTALVDTETGDREQRLGHPEEAERFYRDLAGQGKKVRVGMEASGHARWFERLLVELQFELWIGDATEIESRRVRKAKTDREDARLLLRLLMEDRFPRIWVASWKNRDLQLLWHRHRMGAGPHTDHEPVASSGAERRSTLQEEVVAGTWPETTRVPSADALGKPTTKGSTGVSGSIKSDHR